MRYARIWALAGLGVSVASGAAGGCKGKESPGGQTQTQAAESLPSVHAAASLGGDGGAPGTTDQACEPLTEAQLTLEPYDKTVAGDVENPPVLDEKASLAPLYEHLAALARKRTQRHVRLGFYGDSNMTMDFISGGMRRFLQKKFGDGGHGFVALARPWGWYRHMDVRHDVAESSWSHFATSTHPTWDGQYGLSNICAESKTPGAWSWVETAKDDAPIGQKASSIDVYYMKRPVAGAFEIKVDGKVVKEIDAQADAIESAFEHLDVPDGPHKLAIAVTKGRVRMLGATLERTEPSVIVDSFGVGSLNFDQFNRVSAESRDPMLKRRGYDLVMFMLGTNVFATEEKTVKDVELIVKWYRAALPDVPLLFLSPPDQDEGKGKPARSARHVIKMGALVKRIAEANGVGFWDFRGAMGGDDSMGKFSKAGYADWDFTHFREKGGQLMGERLSHALFAGLRDYAKKNPRAGCKEK